jgi:hypothetical protein
MSKLSTEHTLLALLPILLVLIAVVGALVFFPQNTDNRSKASEPKSTPTMVKLASPTPVSKPVKKSETVCTDLYMPVCGRDGQTYGNSCEANLKGVIVASQGACKSML